MRLEIRTSSQFSSMIWLILAMRSGCAIRSLRAAAISMGDSDLLRMKLPFGTISCMSGSQMKTGTPQASASTRVRG